MQLRSLHQSFHSQAYDDSLPIAQCLVRDGNADNPIYLVSWHGKLFHNTENQSALLPLFEEIIVEEAKRKLDDRILLHAGAVAAGTNAILFPGASGSGKSTLVTAMVSAGFDYLSDEVAVIDPESGDVMPFAKPIALREGGWQKCSRRIGNSVAIPAMRGENEKVWYFAPPQRPLCHRRHEIKLIILPHYDSSVATSELIPISRGTAFSEIVEQSFNLHKHGYSGISTLTKIVQNAACYRLIVNYLDRAIELVHQAIA